MQTKIAPLMKDVSTTDVIFNVQKIENVLPVKSVCKTFVMLVVDLIPIVLQQKIVSTTSVWIHVLVQQLVEPTPFVLYTIMKKSVTVKKKLSAILMWNV